MKTIALHSVSINLEGTAKLNDQFIVNINENHIVSFVHNSESFQNVGESDPHILGFTNVHLTNGDGYMVRESPQAIRALLHSNRD